MKFASNIIPLNIRMCIPFRIGSKMLNKYERINKYNILSV